MEKSSDPPPNCISSNITRVKGWQEQNHFCITLYHNDCRLSTAVISQFVSNSGPNSSDLEEPPSFCG